MNKILIVEDDLEIAMLQQDYLEIAGFSVDIISDGLEAEAKIPSGDWNLILLDVMLPGKSGYDICRKIRDTISIPILMVTARGESIDKIRGLGLGANDYIVKPFDPAELVARVKSQLAQYNRLVGDASQQQQYIASEKIVIDNLTIYPKSWKAYKNGEEIKFPNREFELLTFFAENPNIVFSKEQLFEKIWGFDYIGSSATVTVHIGRIRDKIEDDPQNPEVIETIWGAGYRLNRLN